MKRSHQYIKKLPGSVMVVQRQHSNEGANSTMLSKLVLQGFEHQNASFFLKYYIVKHNIIIL